MRHAAILAVVLTFAGLASHHADAQIAWQKDGPTALAKAKAEGKLMLLHFYDDNCIYCDKLEEGAFQDAKVIEAINRNYVTIKVHAMSNPKLKNQYKVDAFPTEVIVTTDGTLLNKYTSPQNPRHYVLRLAETRMAYTRNLERIAAAKPTSTTQPAAAPAATQPVATQPAAATSNGFALPNAVPTASATSVTANPAPANPAPATVSAPSGGFQLPAGPALPPAAALAADTASQQVVQSAELKSNATAVVTETSVPEANAAEAAATNAQPSSAPLASAAKPASSRPKLAMEGFCAVTVVKKEQWVEGKTEFGVIHLGKLYLFASQETMDAFLKEPMLYTPVLNEIDVVQFFDEKKIVVGKREWAAFDPVHNRMFFFADEDSLVKFEKQFERYVDPAIDVMQRAVKESNPET